MALIYNVITKVAGDPQIQTLVEISLSWDHDVSPIAYESSNEVSVRGPWRALTDSAGFWSVELTPNSDITPTSVYKVTEIVPDGEVATYFIDLQSDDDAWVATILVDTPAWEDN